MKVRAFLFGVVLLLTACAEAPSEEDPQSVLDKAWKNLADLSASMEQGEITFSGDTELKIDTTALEVEGEGKIRYDSSDPSDMMTALLIDADGKGEIEGQKGSVSLKGEFRAVGEQLYIMVDRLQVESADPQVSLIANLISTLYKSQWISVPSGIFGNTTLLQGSEWQNKELAEVAKEHNFFEVKDVLRSRHYRIAINPDQLGEYLLAMSAIRKTTINPTDLDNLKESVKKLDYDLEVKINGEDKLSWLKATLKADDTASGQQFDAAFEGNFSDLDLDGKLSFELKGDTPASFTMNFKTKQEAKTVDIEVPEGAKPFDLGSLMSPQLPQ